VLFWDPSEKSAVETAEVEMAETRRVPARIPAKERPT